MLPEYITSNKLFLEKIARIKSRKKFVKSIKEANNDQLLALVDICFNLLRGKINLKNRKRVKLANSAEYYRAISRARTPSTARKRIQTGGNPGLIGALVAPVLGAIAQSLLDKALRSKVEE